MTNPRTAAVKAAFAHLIEGTNNEAGAIIDYASQRSTPATDLEVQTVMDLAADAAYYRHALRFTLDHHIAQPRQLPEGACERCAGTGEYRHFGTCFDCGGTGQAIAGAA